MFPAGYNNPENGLALSEGGVIAQATCVNSFLIRIVVSSLQAKLARLLPAGASERNC